MNVLILLALAAPSPSGVYVFWTKLLAIYRTSFSGFVMRYFSSILLENPIRTQLVGNDVDYLYIQPERSEAKSFLKRKRHAAYTARLIGPNWYVYYINPLEEENDDDDEDAADDPRRRSGTLKSSAFLSFSEHPLTTDVEKKMNRVWYMDII